MSGIATQTNELVKKIPKKIRLYATRKTAPGLRYFDKEAVEIGGGKKHRLRLDEMVMIKDNHIAVEQSLLSLIKKTKKKYKKFEVEVENTQDAILAAQEGATIIMLDNFSPSQIIKTIKVLKNKKLRKDVLLEASGGINFKNITKYGKTGVDIISIGSITNSVKGIDVSLEFKNLIQKVNWVQIYFLDRGLEFFHNNQLQFYLLLIFDENTPSKVEPQHQILQFQVLYQKKKLQYDIYFLNNIFLQ